MAENFQVINVNTIVPSKLNPRKSFSQDSLKEMAASIKKNGVLEPVLVRPFESKSLNGKYELIAGERRWRAAQLAGLDQMPVIVKQLNDREVMEIQIIENLQREDLTPLEEAFGFKELAAQRGYTVEQLAEKIGKSKSYIYGIIKLCDLPRLAEKALADGKLSRSAAELIARIPNEELRTKAAVALLQPRFGSPVTLYREVKEHIEQNYMVELKRAPFPLNDETLTAAGTCRACPKMTGNNRDAYPNGRADVCTDPGCYATKLAAFKVKKIKLAEQEGMKVLSDEECKKLFPYGNGLIYSAAYVDLEDQCTFDQKNRSYKQLVGTDLKGELVLAFDPTGKLHQLIPKDSALKFLKEKMGIRVEHSGHYIVSEKEKKRKDEQRFKERVAKASLNRVIDVLVSKIEGRSWGNDAKGLAVWRVVTKAIVRRTWNDAQRQIASRRNLKNSKGDPPGDVRLALEKHIDQLPANKLSALLAEAVVFETWYSYGKKIPPVALDLSKLLEVDIKAIEKEVQSELGRKKK